MIELKEEHLILNPECKFIDHISWLKAVFMRARADNAGEKFDEICELQEKLDNLLHEVFGDR